MKKITKATDNQLIVQFNGGSLSAFEELIERYQEKAFHLALRFTKNQEDAEEVLQDVFTTLYRKLKNFEGKSAFSSWLYRIVVNASFMKLRKIKQTPTSYLEEMGECLKLREHEQEKAHTQRADHQTLLIELRETLQVALQKIPEQYRSVFILRDVDGLSNNEVGEILNISIPAVKSRLWFRKIS